MWILIASIVLFIGVIGFIIYSGKPPKLQDKPAGGPIEKHPVCNRCGIPKPRCQCKQCEFC